MIIRQSDAVLLSIQLMQIQQQFAVSSQIFNELKE